MTIEILSAGPGDAAAVRELAALDDAPPLRGEILLARVDGRALAAASLADGRVVADPFVPTAEVVAMLRLRAAQLRPVRRWRERRRLRPAARPRLA